MSDVRRRTVLGERFIAGSGVEVGAGHDPSLWSRVNRLLFIDKRSKAELETLFQTAIAYEVRTLADAPRNEADFVVAHHVIEHAPDPIGELAKWAALLKPDGRLYVSLPAPDNAGEDHRVRVTFSHLLADFLFARDENHFESRQHIPHFIAQWALMNPDSFWYSRGTVQEFSRITLGEAQRDGNDLHWHTYDLDVMKQAIEAAFWFSGHGTRWVHAEHCDCELHLIVDKAPRGAIPPPVAAEAAAIIGSLRRHDLLDVAPERDEAEATSAAS